MVGPILVSWIEECNQFAGGRVHHMGFAALEFVTPIASSNQIFSCIATAGRARNYMVNNERHPDESARCLTIFATVMGFGRNLLPMHT